MTTETIIPDDAQEAALQAVIDVRDASPRLPNDADSFDVTMAALRAGGPLLIADHLQRLSESEDGPWWALYTALAAEAERLRSSVAATGVA